MRFGPFLGIFMQGFLSGYLFFLPYWCMKVLACIPCWCQTVADKVVDQIFKIEYFRIICKNLVKKPDGTFELVFHLNHIPHFSHLPKAEYCHIIL